MTITTAALLGGFTTSISASAEHRNLVNLDSVLKSYVETAVDQIELQSAYKFTACATTYTITYTAPTGYSASLGTIEYWQSNNTWGSTCSTSTTPPQQQLVMATATNTSNGTHESIQFAVSDPAFVQAVPSSPSITSGSSVTVVAGTDNPFAVTASGFPLPALSASGLPSWVTFTDDGGGNGTLSINPLSTTAGGNYTLKLTATNSVGSSPQQTFTVTVASAPVFSSSNGDTVTVNQAFSFPVTATGFPTPTISESGTLPAGVIFTPGGSGSGTGTLSGTPTATGTSTFTFVAMNTGGGSTPQTFTLVVQTNTGTPPTFTSSSSSTAYYNVAYSFAITATGTPGATITELGALPSGITFTSGGSGTGTGTLSGTTLPTTTAAYTITLTATNSAGSTPQTFTLTADQKSAPTVSYPTNLNQFMPTKNQPFTLGIQGTGFQCGISGLANATVTWTGTGTLGVTCNSSTLITVTGTAPNAHSTSEQFTIENADGGSVTTQTNAFETAATG